MMNPTSKVYIAGHRGLVGSAILRRLQAEGYRNLVLRTSAELELRDQRAVQAFFQTERPEYVFFAAATVGGILANQYYPAEFIYNNLIMQCNSIHAAYESGAKKLLFLGSSCIYPKMAAQPLKEKYLLSGSLEESNQPYAVAKIAGIELCKAYRRQYGCNFVSVMPTNLYGPGDHFDLQNSHVLPALIRKFHEAKAQQQPVVEIWGTGTPRREFLHSDDLADACFMLMQTDNVPDLINVGAGEDISISDLAHLIQEIVGFKGELRFDPSKPDGTPRKLLDISHIQAMGFHPQISLREGITQMYQWYASSHTVRA